MKINRKVIHRFIVKMKFSCVVVLLAGPIEKIHAAEFDCSDLKKTAKELIEAEFMGIRYQGGESLCKDSGKFRSIVVKHYHLGDPALLKPEYLVKKNTPPKIESLEVQPGDLVEVKFSYLNTEGHKIEDQFSFLLNYGLKTRKKGCGSILSTPKHFVMYEDCLPK